MFITFAQTIAKYLKCHLLYIRSDFVSPPMLKNWKVGHPKMASTISSTPQFWLNNSMELCYQSIKKKSVWQNDKHVASIDHVGVAGALEMGARARARMRIGSMIDWLIDWLPYSSLPQVSRVVIGDLVNIMIDGYFIDHRMMMMMMEKFSCFSRQQLNLTSLSPGQNSVMFCITYHTIAATHFNNCCLIY